MKKIILLILISCLAKIGFAQTPVSPVGPITTNTVYYEPSTGRFPVYRGTTYGYVWPLNWRDSTYYITPWYASQHFALIGSGVTSFNSRTGAVVPLVGDYSSFYPLLNGTGATGTWSINISGNAATVTNGVYTNGSYANPSWITSLAWSKITGTPTTLSGYGITDAYTKTQSDVLYAPKTSGSSILYGNGTGGFSNITIGSGVSFAGGTLSATGSGGTVTSITPGYGFTSSTPITTSGTLTIDTTKIRDVTSSIRNNNLQNYNGFVFIGDSQTEGYGISVSGGNISSQSYPQIVATALQKPSGINNAVGYTNFGNSSLYGFTTSGSVSLTTMGPTNTAIVLQSGASISWTAAADEVAFWYVGATSGGTINVAYNGTTYRTVACSSYNSNNVSSFDGTFKSPSSASGTYTLTATGGAVTITAIFPTLKKPSGNNALYFLRDAVASQGFGSFSTANISATTPLQSLSQTIFLNVLGQNNIFNSGGAISSSAYAANVVAYNNALSINRNKMVYVMPANIPQPTILEPYSNYRDSVYSVCGKYNIPLIDLSLAGLTNSDYASDNIHWNASGNAKVASYILSFFQSNDVSLQAFNLAYSPYLDQTGSKVYSRTSGTNTYTATVLPTFSALTEGQLFNILFVNGNTSANPTLNINGLGAKNITYAQANLAAYDINNLQELSLLYDGTAFQVLGPASNSFIRNGSQTHASLSIDGNIATSGGNINAGGAVQASSFVSGYEFRGSSYGGGKAAVTVGTAIAESSTTSTELSYLIGATSNIQTQLNNKIGLTSLSATAPITYNNTTGVIASTPAASGVAGYVSTGTQTWDGNKTNSGNFSIGGNLTTTGTTRLNGNIGLNTAPSTSINILQSSALTGSTGVEAFDSRGTVANTVTSSAYYFNTLMSTAASTTISDVIGYGARSLSIGAGSSINRLIGFYAQGTLTGGTSTYGFLTDIAATSGAYGFYNGGGANNYLGNGFTGINYTSDPTSGNKFGVNGNSYFNGNILNTTLTASQLVATDASKNLVSVTALPNPTTATTQSAGDNSTKVATTAYVDGAANSGTYTPTITNISNVTSNTPFVCNYTRVGTVVTVSGYFSITPTSALTNGTVVISLPVASNLSNTYELTGLGECNNTGNISNVTIGAETTSDKAQLDFKAGASTSSQTIFFNFSYKVI